MIMNAKQRKQLAVRARTSIRENFGIPSAIGWLPVCAAMTVKWSHPFVWVLTAVEEIDSDSSDIEAVGVGTQFDTNHGEMGKCRFSSIVASSVAASLSC